MACYGIVDQNTARERTPARERKRCVGAGWGEEGYLLADLRREVPDLIRDQGLRKRGEEIDDAALQMRRTLWRITCKTGAMRQSNDRVG